MGDISVILEGVDSEASRDILYSTVHGAGRIMSRTEAAGKPRRDGSRSGGKISVEAMLNRVKKRGVELRGAGTDEAPQVYRQLQDVLDAHQGTINILHTLTPVGVAMAGADTVDPYKD
jgi:tRNA-splicing ligase RtcB